MLYRFLASVIVTDTDMRCMTSN